MIDLTKPPADARPEHKQAWHALMRASVELSRQWFYEQVLRDAATLSPYAAHTIHGRKFSRVPAMFNVRRAVWWMLREVADLSYPEIGRMVGRDHTTIMSALATIECSDAWPLALQLADLHEKRERASKAANDGGDLEAA